MTPHTYRHIKHTHAQRKGSVRSFTSLKAKNSKYKIITIKGKGNVEFGASHVYNPGLPTMRGHLYRPKARGSGDELTLTIIEMIFIFVKCASPLKHLLY